MLNILNLLLLAIAISSCSLYGPKYVKPSLEQPSQWRSRDYLASTESANLPSMAWWRKFNDRQLNYLIESALSNNNNIQVAVGNIQAAQGQLKQIQYAWIPNITAIADYTNTMSNFSPIGYGTGLMPNYSLNIIQLIRSTEYAKANLAAVKAAKDAVRLTVISQTCGGYFSLLGQEYLLKLQTRLVNDMGELLRLSKIEYNKGLLSFYTLQQYEQQYQTAKAQLPIIQNNIIAAQNTLRVLLNQNPGLIKTDLDFMHLPSFGLIPVNLPAQVLKNRPDIQQSEQQLIAANANIGVATATFFPSISLTGALGTASTDLTKLFTPGTDFWNKQIDATMPILSFSTYGQIEQAKGSYYAAYYNYVQSVRLAFAAVDNDLSAHARYASSLATQFRYYDSAKVQYDLAKISYTKGLYSYPVLLNNKINVDNASIALAQSKLAQLNTIVQLYQDLAGGYMVGESKVF